MSIILDEIKQDWKININNKNKIFPYLYIDNWYTKKEEEKIWKELDFHSSNELNRAEDTIVSKDKKGKPLGSSYRIYLNEIYTLKGQFLSPVYKYMYKFRKEEFWKNMEDAMPQGVYFKTTNSSSTFVSYYEQNDYYDTHFDTALFTCLIWMHKPDKLYTGGDFIFPQSDSIVESINNRMLIFPCYYLHKVTPIKFKKEQSHFGNGRYTITHFFSYNQT